MQSRETLKRHATLVDDMAGAVGVDLEAEVLDGHLRISELDDVVLRCTGCSKPDACTAWLAKQTVQAASPPEYCRNASLFAELKRM
ncbi:MAG: DUF6455 family protein [Pelagimonas sp.]|uniref:DUF6455 family protein n=1 Tax=Pelagimonas sp. TaxID=2073170 RepID=UPI003D6BF8EA